MKPKYVSQSEYDAAVKAWQIRDDIFAQDPSYMRVQEETNPIGAEPTEMGFVRRRRKPGRLLGGNSGSMMPGSQAATSTKKPALLGG